MLLELSIKNFAIIRDLKIEFTEGLNLLTGETGSGKSIIIEALGIILGARSSKDLVLSGEDKAILEAVFLIENYEKLSPVLSEYGIDIDEGNILIITREISTTLPSISRINGRTVTLATLNKITSNLVDIFGQHEHQSLLNISNHQKLIDNLGDEEFRQVKENIRKLYGEYVKEMKELNSMNLNSQEREREIDLLQFQLDEIDNANLSQEDEYEIENQFKKLSNIKDISFGLGEIIDILNTSSYESKSILDLLGRVISILNNLKRFDTNLNPYMARLEEVRYEIQDISRELLYYSDNLVLDEETLNYLNDRINLVNKLKKKYGNTIDKIKEYRKTVYNRLEILNNYEEEIEIKTKKIKNLEESLSKFSNIIRVKRKEIAKILEKRISEELSLLNMPNVIFKVNFDDSGSFTAEGIDKIEFLISTNPGEDLKPLSRIISGGEMSRIMLGFKSILAKYDEIPTLIFDEIDTGISGRTAQVVGEKISKISREHQVICVSHLPQIVALADSHYLISKETQDSRTITNIQRLTVDDRIKELARLLGGVNLTDTTLSHAKEMLEMSKKIKIKSEAF